MRLLIKLDYGKKFMTKELSSEEAAAFLKAIDGGSVIKETYVAATSSYKAEIDTSSELEVEVILKGSSRVDMSLRQLTIEAVIEKEAEEAKVSTTNDTILF